MPFSFGYPLGKPNDAAFQHRVIDQTLGLLNRNDTPILESFRSES
ncbi:MAG: hypothetical protein R2681_07790 [Pyrinomonadaceae bacterium]